MTSNDGALEPSKPSNFLKDGRVLTLEAISKMAKEYYEILEGDLQDIGFALNDPIVHVCSTAVRFRDTDLVEKRWLVCGDIPFVDFSTVDLPGPEDVLALYLWYLGTWPRAMNKETYPVFRDPYSWRILTVADLGPWYTTRVIYVRFHVVDPRKERIATPEIRDLAREVGIVFAEDWAKSPYDERTGLPKDGQKP